MTNWKKLEKELEARANINLYDKKQIEKFAEDFSLYWRTKFTRKKK